MPRLHSPAGRSQDNVGRLTRQLTQGIAKPFRIVPVFWIENPAYLFVTLIAALLTFFAHTLIVKMADLILWLDALGLAVFCVLGSEKALSIGAGPVVAIVMGVITAVAGGIIRDVIANESPLVLHKEVYATAAFAGALSYALAPFSGSPAIFLRLVRINTLLHHSEKYRHPWELLSILSFGRLHLRVE